jgi:hypothetical protein
MAGSAFELCWSSPDHSVRYEGSNFIWIESVLHQTGHGQLTGGKRVLLPAQSMAALYLLAISKEIEPRKWQRVPHGWGGPGFLFGAMFL